jgi:hypothetical protein
MSRPGIRLDVLRKKNLNTYFNIIIEFLNIVQRPGFYLKTTFPRLDSVSTFRHHVALVNYFVCVGSLGGAISCNFRRLVMCYVVTYCSCFVQIAIIQYLKHYGNP